MSFSFFRNTHKPFSFLAEASPAEKFKYGMLMWFCLFFGYFIFITNWIIMGKLQGGSSGGWAQHFSVAGDNYKVITEAVDYSVSFARGLATIPVAWLMTKVSHKWAAVMALLLNTVAVPLIYFPYYSLFVVGRMIMGFGGTMLIILIQPILVRFFDLKHKGILSMLTPMAYISGALISNALFVHSSMETYFQNKWQIVAVICAAFSYFPLIFYLLLGKNFSTADNMQEEIDQREFPGNTYFGIIKEKSMWFWIIWYSLLLVASLIVSLKAPEAIEKITTSISSSSMGNSWKWKSVYSICFYLGCFGGVVLGKWNKTEYRRKPFVMLACGLGIFFWCIILGMSLVSKYYAYHMTATVIIFISVFWYAFFSMGIQSVILYIPHEYEENDNAKRLTIFYSYLWGVGYIIFTVYQIINASFMSISSFGHWLSVGIISVWVIMFGVLAMFIKEPRPQFKLHPWSKN